MAQAGISVRRVRDRRPEESVGPLLGERPGLGEHDGDAREPHLRLRETLGDDGRSGVGDLEDLRVPVFDDERGVGQLGQRGEQVAELAGGHGRDQVRKALALDCGHDRAVELDREVARGKPQSAGRGLLGGELPRAPLVAVDEDLEHLTRRPPGGNRDVRSGLARGAGALPEDDLASAGSGEHELRAVLTTAVEHQVDRRAAAQTPGPWWSGQPQIRA
jgi:hypothetical protein